MRPLTVIGAFILLILLAGCIPVTHTETYIDKEEYTVDVSYQEQEAYTEPLKYEVVEERTYGTISGLNTVTKGVVRIKNIDIETGEFTVEQTFITLNDPPKTYKTTKRITSGETTEFVETYDSDRNEDVKRTFIVKSSSLTKFRTVTKVRPEIRIRNVTKTRNVTEDKFLGLF